MPKQVRNRKQFSRAASRPSPDWEFHWPLLDWLLQFLKPAPRPRGPTILFDLPQARSRQTHSPLCQRNGKAAPLQWGQPSGSRLGGAATEQRRQGADQQREPRGHDGRGSAGHRAGGPLRRDGGLGRGVAGTPRRAANAGGMAVASKGTQTVPWGAEGRETAAESEVSTFSGVRQGGVALEPFGGCGPDCPSQRGGSTNKAKPELHVAAQDCNHAPRGGVNVTTYSAYLDGRRRLLPTTTTSGEGRKCQL